MGLSYSVFNKSTCKRCVEESDDDDLEIPTQPVKKKLRTTDYIYQQLFVNGLDSDITVSALGHEWHLHKVYLAQSPYFASMFNGGWKEATQKRIFMSIPNRQITFSSLDQVFGSLYKDDIEIHPNEVTSLVAVATLLQLDCLIAQCSDVMCENLSSRNIMKFYVSSEENGLIKVRQACIEWLCRNLMRFTSNVQFLRSISVDLMSRLIECRDLMAVQGEVDLYSMLKKWIYIKSRIIAYNGKKVLNLKVDADEWFLSRKDMNASFLELNCGSMFLPVFMNLRLQNMLTQEKCVQTLLDDNIIPKCVIEKVLALKWRMQLCVENEYECNAEQTEATLLPVELSEDEFYRLSIRCGRILPQDTPHCWRWSGYFHGIDILLSYKHRTLYVKRNCTHHVCPYSVNFKVERSVYYRMVAISFDKQRKVSWSDSTLMKRVVMKADDCFAALTIPDHVRFPVTIGFWYHVTPVSAGCRQLIQDYCNVWKVIDEPGRAAVDASASSVVSSATFGGDGHSGSSTSNVFFEGVSLEID